MNTRVPIDSEALLEEVSWVRALARRLVWDVEAAEDVAQDALVVALSGSQAEPRALRQWLGAIVRNLSRNALRREGRRARVEAPLTEDPALPSTLELLERAATQRALVGTLLELEEPDRSVLLLRYFQELSNEEIARHWGVSASTVATRLARAHARLRTKWLAHNGGDRRTGLAALAALAHGATERVPAPAAEQGTGEAVRTGLVGALQAAALVSVLAGAAWWLRSASAQEPEPLATRALEPVDRAAAPALPSAAASPSDLVTLAAFLQDGRRAVASAPAPPTPSKPICPAPGGQRYSTRGRVLDLEGRAVAALEVCRNAPFVSRPGDPATRRGAPTDDCATSDDGGRFSMNVPRLGRFAASSPGWTTVLSGELPLDEGGESLLVVARSQPLAGRVVDERGRPLAGVEVALEIAPQRLLALGQVLDAAMPMPRTLVTDESGAFACDDAPRADLVVAAWKEGFERHIVELADPFGDPFTWPKSSAQDSGFEPLHLVLKQSSLPTVIGTVVDASGQPVEGASVSAGQGIASSDAAGSFLVTFDPEHWSNRPCAEHGRSTTAPERPESIELRAARADLGMARCEIAFPPAGAPQVAVQLVLASQAQTIEGRVLDLRGEPVASVEVFVLEDTLFGWEPVEGSGSISHRSLESMLGASPASTSADGSFRIVGLSERSYRLQVLHAERLLSTISYPIPSGSRGVVLTFDPEARGRIAGRTVDRQGQPVAGVRVSVSCRQWWAGPEDRDFALAIGAATETDSEGRFALEDVAHAGVFLRLEGHGIVPDIFRDIDSEPERTTLELVVGRRCHLQFHWGDWSERADRLHLEAEDGTTLGFMDLRGWGVTPLDSIPVDTGLSPAIAIPDHALHAVLTRGGREVTRVPLAPVPGELELVRL